MVAGTTTKKNKTIDIIPQSIQMMCLGILSTLCQHNPPVQKELLELGSLKILTNLFFQHMVQYYQYQYQQQHQQRQQEEEGEEIKQSNHHHHHHRYYNNEHNIKFCSKIIQAMSANVRSYELAETLFLNLNEQSKQFIELGLGMKVINTTTTTNKKKKRDTISFPLSIRKRTLFFLSSLLSSDVCTSEYIDKLFINSIDYVIENFIIPQQREQPQREQPQREQQQQERESIDGTIAIDEELREHSVLMIETLLEQKKCLSSLLLKVPKYKFIIELANQRQRYINTLPKNSDDEEFAKIEYQSWDHIKLLLRQEQQQHQHQQQRQRQQQQTSSSDSSPLLLLS